MSNWFRVYTLGGMLDRPRQSISQIIEGRPRKELMPPWNLRLLRTTLAACLMELRAELSRLNL
jgi:hypothetical protein